MTNESPAAVLERLRKIAAERYYRVIYACSHYGKLYDTREEAEAYKADLLARVDANGERRASCYVAETDGWDEAISEEGEEGREYCRDMLRLIEHQQCVIERLMAVLNKYARTNNFTATNVLDEIKKNPMKIDREWIRGTMEQLQRNCGHMQEEKARAAASIEQWMKEGGDA